MEDWELPAPPANYPFAAPEYLYAPRREDDPTPRSPKAQSPGAEPADAEAPGGVAAGAAESAAPPMVWSAATSTWVPAPPAGWPPSTPPAPGPAAPSATTPAPHPDPSPVPTETPVLAGSPDPRAVQDRVKRRAGGSRNGRPGAGAMRRARKERRARQEQQARRAVAARPMRRARPWTWMSTPRSAGGRPPWWARARTRILMFLGPQGGPPATKTPLLLTLATMALVTIVAAIFAVGYQHSPRHGRAGPTAGLPAPAATGPRLADLLDAQDAAMQRGDEAGFLAAVDPLAADTFATYRRIFTNLRAMHVSRFGQGSPDGGTVVDLPGHHRVDVSLCLGDIDYCSPRTVTFDVTVERRDASALIEAVDFVDGLDGPTSPQPWEVSDLTVRIERGLLVAASPATSARLPAIVPVIEKAARVARGYAVLTMVPDQYTVYVGDDTDRETWFGGHSTAATQVVDDPGAFNDLAVEVLLPEAAATGPLGGNGLAATVRGALARATLFNDAEPRDDMFVAGMVAYASYHGDPATAKDALAAAAAYVRSGQWDGSCYYAPASSGLGYLVIGYLTSKYGFAKTLAFWGDVERSDNSLNTASIGEFGVKWATVDLACSTYVRGAAKG